MVEMRLRRRRAFFPGIYKRKNKAQSILEYAVIIACLVAALLAMQTYMQRGMQGRLREVADQLSGQHYVPTNTTGNFTLAYNSTSQTTVETLNEVELTAKHGYDFDVDGDGKITDKVFATESRSDLKDSTTTQKGNETIGEMEKSLF